MMDWIVTHEKILITILQLVINFLVTLTCIIIYHMVYHQKPISTTIKSMKKRVAFKTDKPEYHRSASGKSKFEILDEYLSDEEIVKKDRFSDDSDQF